MKIKSLKIDLFGKLKLKNPIKLSDGLNVIYGPNEAGKSTVQNFIKVMFFGMDSRRGKSKEISERDSLIPWDSDTCGGYIVVEADDGKEYRIQRKFNKNNYKNDTLEVIEEVTGTEKKIFAEPGNDFMGISKDTFENTLFVRQLSCSNVRDDNRQIYSRIVSLRETGNENIQAGKAKDILAQKISDLESRKKEVSIDAIDKEIEEKKNELSRLIALHRRMMDHEQELNAHRLHCSIAENNIRMLEKKKKNAEFWKKRRVYETAFNYIVEKREVNEKLSTLQEYAKFSNADKEGYISLKNRLDNITAVLEEKLTEKKGIEDTAEKLNMKKRAWTINKEEIEELRDKKQEYRSLIENYNVYNKKLIEVKVKLSDLKEEISKYEAFKNYQDDIDMVLKEKLDEINNIEKAITECENNIKNYNKIDEVLTINRNKLKEITAELGYDGEVPDVNESDFEKEEFVSRELAGMNNNGWLIRKNLEKERLENEKRNLENSIQGPKYNLIPSICIFAAGILGSIVYLPILILSIAGVAYYIYGQKIEKKKFETLEAIKENVDRVTEEVREAEERRKENNDWLDDFYKKLGVHGREEFLKKKKQFENFFTEKRKLDVVIEEFKKGIEGIDIQKQISILEEMKSKRDSLEQFVTDAYKSCECDNYYAFCKKFKQYLEVRGNLASVEEIYNNTTQDLDSCDKGINAVRERVSELFGKTDIKPGDNVIASIEQLVTEYEENLKVIDAIGANEIRLSDIDREIDRNNKQIDEIKTQIDDILSSVGADSEKDFIDGIEKYNEYVLYSQRNGQLDQLIASTIGEHNIEQLEIECREIECEYSDDSVEEIDAELKHETSRLHKTKENIIRLETTIDNITGLEEIPVLEEEIKALEADRKKMQFKLDSLKISQYILAECLDEMTREFGTVLNSRTEEIIKQLTGGRYNQVKVDEDNFSIKAHEPDANKFVSVNLLSNGTVDQMYFAMRLAIADMIENNTTLPVILDDAFIQYDDERLKNTVEFLLEHSRERQIILFTCHDREYGVLKELGKLNHVNFFDLSKAE